ncbi:MAG: nicotinate-nucleotide adenylyltransferase [Candidatus Omnitrophota bacterium]
MKIGLLGGTFNPIHAGHLILAQECWYRLKLDKVIFIPAYAPPHKQVEGDISVPDRLNMLRLALHGDTRFEISTYEIDQNKIVYSVDTIRFFIDKYGDSAEIFFLTGSDSSQDLFAWKNIEKILDLTTFIIAVRPGWEKQSLYEQKVKRTEMPLIDISSSMIRDRIRKCEPIDYFVPSTVVQYIRDKGLYR